MSSPSRLQFRPSLVPSVAALVGVLLTVHLGEWQRGRAAEKRTLQAEFDARESRNPLTAKDLPFDAAEHRYRRAKLSGAFDANGTIYIDNQSNGTTVGYHVIVPFRVSDASGREIWVLVNRGWIGRGTNYPRPPSHAVPSGSVEVHGMLVSPNKKFLELSADVVNGSVWQNLTVERYAVATKRSVAALVLNDETATGLVPVRERPDARVEKHVEYMLTWYSLCVTIVLLWIGLNLKFRKSENAL